jgi:hypothetical protein
MKGIHSNHGSVQRKAGVTGVPLRLTKEKRFDLNGFSELMGLYEEMCAIARNSAAGNNEPFRCGRKYCMLGMSRDGLVGIADGLTRLLIPEHNASNIS